MTPTAAEQRAGTRQTRGVCATRATSPATARSHATFATWLPLLETRRSKRRHLRASSWLRSLPSPKSTAVPVAASSTSPRRAPGAAHSRKFWAHVATLAPPSTAVNRTHAYSTGRRRGCAGRACLVKTLDLQSWTKRCWWRQPPARGVPLAFGERKIDADSTPELDRGRTAPWSRALPIPRDGFIGIGADAR